MDLSEAVPAYVVCFSLALGAHGMERRPYVHGRDAPLLADRRERGA